jgi:hypothetical protein
MTSLISKVQALSDHDLKSRIRRGRAWLIAHSQDKVGEIGTKYEPDRWEKNLEVYEALADEAQVRSFSETDCWEYEKDTLPFESLSTEEKWLRQFES